LTEHLVKKSPDFGKFRLRQVLIRNGAKPQSFR